MFEIFLVSWGMIVLLINFPPRTAFAVSHGVSILCFNFHLCLGISLLPLWFLEWSIGCLLSYCLASTCLKFLQFFSLFLFYYLFICGCSGSSLLRGLFSSWVSGGGSLVVLRGLLPVVALCCRAQAAGHVAAVVVARGRSGCLWALQRRLRWLWPQSCLLQGTWHFPRPGTKPMSLVLAGGFLTPELQGSSCSLFLISQGCDWKRCLIWF